MLEQLEQLEQRYKELEQQLADPQVVTDQNRLQEVAKAHADLEEIMKPYWRYKEVLAGIEGTKALLEELHGQTDSGDSDVDTEMVELAEAEIENLSKERDELEHRLKLLLMPKDPNDEKNVVMEIRAGTGGEEAALFAGDLFRMYCRYAEKRGWNVEMMSQNPTGLGGFKEVIFLVSGAGAYSRLKRESGVHRVQRIPETEASGRIHTSAATVAVLPEAEEVDIEIDPNDLRIDVFRSSGHGGQSVNTTDSAVRITHIPTGMVVTCQDEKSQLKNRTKALKILRSRLLQQKAEEQRESLASERRSQVGSGDRSERIRTYNFPQNRVTDHRIGLTLYKLDSFMDGELDEIIDALLAAEEAQKLAAAGS
ncbi:MAG: peptide chain release factor 1 [Bacillota bacterium]|jgi:peptide chain release factor 1|nr:peptide chain release factor 1 [Bacillota bacterium]HOB90373.1 peptide chain release factor 1 [Bacillota bacterium]HPZ53887.1 peptide chain release factor 1 [Bacillota bacterium]HQD17396.1 peptide chain release factor 1 [Bacillota bacterium]